MKFAGPAQNSTYRLQLETNPMTPSPDSDSSPKKTTPDQTTPDQRRESLVQGRCTACEGGTEALPGEQARQYLEVLPKWELEESSGSISRQINGGSFVKVIDLVNRIADLAEEEQHHPDLHVTGYRHLKIVLTTHAIGGLSENDFIVAAKIDDMLG